MLTILFVARFWTAPTTPDPAGPLVEGDYRVVRVVDGDTIIVAPDVKIRLIGVNTPETVKPDHPVEPWGPEASAFTRKFLRGGRARLTFDRERVDRFGRLLAYVRVDDRLLNEELVRHGLAYFEPHFQYGAPMKSRFREAEREAKRSHRGIWSQSTPPHPAA